LWHADVPGVRYFFTTVVKKFKRACERNLIITIEGMKDHKIFVRVLIQVPILTGKLKAEHANQLPFGE
jgi:hypothetical protein